MSEPRPESQPAQQQDVPGTLGQMDPKPDHGEESLHSFPTRRSSDLDRKSVV